MDVEAIICLLPALVFTRDVKKIETRMLKVTIWGVVRSGDPFSRRRI